MYLNLRLLLYKERAIKLFFLNIQVVADCDMLIRDAYTGWPGCTHDARVLRNSSLFDKAENGQCIVQGHFIIADSAYPLRNWLMTLFRDRFNRMLSSARQIVERVYGHLKGRFGGFEK